MDFKTVMEKIEKANNGVPKPVELLSKLDESLVVDFFQNKMFVMQKENLPNKFKTLIMLSAAIALDSEDCILKNVKSAKAAGASKEEIMDTYALARFVKSAVALPKTVQAFEWLLENE
jgi:alkylhydroperoxidase/carboxymuconolactone decarboxylase family protein YurZ